MLFPAYKLKYISKIRDIPKASRGSRRMSTSKASVQETIFLSLKQYLMEYWIRFYILFYILNRRDKLLENTQTIHHLKYTLGNFMFPCLQIAEFWDYDLGYIKNEI